MTSNFLRFFHFRVFVKTPYRAENGNVLWFILIAIVLLGSVTVFLSRSGSSVDQSGDTEQARIKASQILRYAKSVEIAVQQLRLNGCAENDISFENAVVAGYENTNNPDNEDCFVFAERGGGLAWQTFGAGSAGSLENIVFPENIQVIGVGTDGNTGSDLVMFIASTSAVCERVNRDYGISIAAADITSDIDTVTRFTGSYDTPDFQLGDAAGEAPGLDGKTTGCFIDDNDVPTLYHVLHSR